ncbi:MAG: diaminopimelate epimerase [Planctomycetes bacterium]|nr:diaminopimelate epimerase [Planctomycetota bacterium]
MRFTKMHGVGNDYIYVDAARERVPNPSRLARAISDRRTGVGSDGLILIAPSKRADFRMIMYNADGSESAMCGNGIRCIGKYVYERKLTKKKTIDLETKSGVVRLDLRVRKGKVDEVTVDMGKPRPIPPQFHVRADGRTDRLEASVEVENLTLRGTVISMGNPHFVVEVEDPDLFPVERFGPAIERHPDFPSRVNVEFVRVLGGGRVRQRTWERGSGETLACGSGACATAVALQEAGRVGSRVPIDLRGGTLLIERAPDGRVLMTGPVAEIFRGEWLHSTANARRATSLK